MFPFSTNKYAKAATLLPTCLTIHYAFRRVGLQQILRDFPSQTDVPPQDIIGSLGALRRAFPFLTCMDVALVLRHLSGGTLVLGLNEETGEGHAWIAFRDKEYLRGNLLYARVWAENE